MFKNRKARRVPDADGAPWQAPASAPAAAPDVDRLAAMLAERISTLGHESAEVRGAIDDTVKVATAQAQAVHELELQLREVVSAQREIADESRDGLAAVARAGEVVQAVAAEVGGVVDTLRQVSDAAAQITQIATQTRLVAFNASVEAKRAGEAGRGFGVVADAVKELAANVEASSKDIMGTVTRLDGRIAALAREIRRDGGDGRDGRSAASGEGGAVHKALDRVAEGVQRIHAASGRSGAVCDGLDAQMAAIEQEMRRTSGALEGARARTDTFLAVSEQLLESVVECGVETEDTPYVRAAQQAAAQIGQLLDDALGTGAIGVGDLFDEQYRAVPGSAPEQHLTRFVGLAERLFPQVQEKALTLSDKVVFCIAVDRNSYVACHNRRYNQPQRPGDLVWNTANCRNRRIFADRTGLASARNERPFLLQTYRRDMGGGSFVVMKEAAAPIRAAGRHWGGLRLAFKF